MKRLGKLVVDINPPNDNLKPNLRPNHGRWSIQERLSFIKGNASM